MKTKQAQYRTLQKKKTGGNGTWASFIAFFVIERLLCQFWDGWEENKSCSYNTSVRRLHSLTGVMNFAKYKRTKPMQFPDKIKLSNFKAEKNGLIIHSKFLLL